MNHLYLDAMYECVGLVQPLTSTAQISVKKTFAFEIQVMQDLTKISFNFLEVGKPPLLEEAKQISHSRKAKHNSLLKTV